MVRKWLLNFNVDKCKIMHISHEMKTVYNLLNKGKIQWLAETECEKDLGVVTTMNLKPSLQCTKSYVCSKNDL